MGINFKQSCMVGVELDEEKCLSIEEPAQYEEQPRYNPKTGEETHKEKVLVKQEKSYYSAFGVKSLGFVDLVEDVAKKINCCHCWGYGHEKAVLGIPIGEKIDYGGADLLYGKYNLEEISELFVKAKTTFGDGAGPIKLYFASNVG